MTRTFLIPFPPSGSRRGAALVIVLGFVVLLTVVVLAFLSSSMIQRQVSSANSRYFDTSDFALGAANTVIGDLQQEIAAGSIPQTVGGNTVYQPFGAPDAIPATVGFTRQMDSGTAVGVENDGLNNLVKVSVAQPFYPTSSYYPATGLPAVPNRASAALTTTASLNGRSVSLARWNKHLLLTKQTPGGTDPTPVAAFPTPQWILVGRDGTNPTTVVSDPTNNSYVVGRYAYAIYDEGGLLDANVAGYPSVYSGGNPIASSPALTGAQLGAKTAESFADLTQIPIDGSDPSGTPQAFLGSAASQPVVDALVGWRGQASLAAGNSPNYAPGAQASTFFTNVFSDTAGFLRLPPSSVAQLTKTDHLFSSRQQLINFFVQQLGPLTGFSTTTATAYMQNALQYFTTFSRDLDQPSYWPDPNRPRIYPTTFDTTGSPTPNSFTNYKGNNDAAGQDDQINPPFPTTVVTTPFPLPRYDGSSATVGEPLVKKRFPLARLAWLTYQGPAASSFSGLPAPYQNAVLNEGISQAEINAGTAANIKTCFGLTWGMSTGYVAGGEVASNCWTYVGHDNSLHIDKLSEVQAEGREPDFFELLKAAITTGSLGKSAAAATNSFPVQGAYQHTMDSTTDYQIIQIGANIIDQFDPDGFPTHIEFNNGSGEGVRDFFGIENLPYYYGNISTVVTNSRPSAKPPYLASAGATWVADGTTVNDPFSSVTSGPAGPAKTNAITYQNSYFWVPVPTYYNATNAPAWTTTGQGIALGHPVLWNPHEINSSPGVSQGTTKCYPTQFRFSFDQVDPGGNSMTMGSSNSGVGTTITARPVHSIPAGSTTYPPTGGFNLYSYWWGDGGNLGTTDGWPASGSSPSISTRYTIAMTEMDFTFDASQNPSTSPYREPTVLRSPNLADQVTIPSSNLSYQFSGSSAGFYPAYPLNGNESYFGIYYGSFPLRWTGPVGEIVNLTIPPSTTYVPVTIPTPSQVPTTPTPTGIIYTASGVGVGTPGGTSGSSVAGTVRLDYKDSSGQWETYDIKYTPTLAPGAGWEYGIGFDDTWRNIMKSASFYFDPRTSRFCAEAGGDYMADQQNKPAAFAGEPPWTSTAAPPFLDPAGFSNLNGGGGGDIILSQRPTQTNGGIWIPNVGDPMSASSSYSQGGLSAAGWFVHISSGGGGSNGGSSYSPTGIFAQNRPDLYLDFGATWWQAYYTDPDGVLRRGMAAYANTGSQQNQAPAVQNPALDMGLPTVPESGPYFNSGVGKQGTTQSRPIVLNRPFRSVAELGYVFRGTPWKNIDFFTAQSGDAALLDVFCVQENADEPASAVVAGKVNLNTRQLPVLQAILNGAYRDETANTVNPASNNQSPLTATEAKNVAETLMSRTYPANPSGTPNKGPLLNLSQLVGKFISGAPNTTVDPFSGSYLFNQGLGSSVTGYFDGFSSDLAGVVTANPSPYAADATNAKTYIQRYLETGMRALADVGTTRTWNLMIDVVAQTGRYPTTATGLDNFLVQGEQHYWVHVAIDRYTGKVIDENVEVVKE